METKNKKTEVIKDELNPQLIADTSVEIIDTDVKNQEISEVQEVVETPVEPAKERTPKAKPAPRQPKANTAKQKPTLGRLISDGNDLIAASMPIDIQNAEIARMETDIKKKAICYGKVIGVEKNETSGIVMVVKRENIRVIIPATDFFAYSSMKDMENATRDELITRYRQKGVHMFGAAISFVPKAIGKNEDGIPFVVASRKESMDKLQERHFFGPNADVAINSMAKASIISVGPRYVAVECLGIETTLGTGALSAFEYLSDASEKFRPGQGLIVAVESLEVDKENRTIQISLSHSLVERLEANVEGVNDSMINGRYLAKVVAVIENYYIVIVTGLKVRGLVPKRDYVGVDALIPGDSVSMFVTGIDKEKGLVIGRCMKTS